MMKKSRIIGPCTVLALLTIATPVVAQEPDALQTYLGMKDQLEVGLPAGWSVFDQGAVRGGKRAKTGPPIVFSAEVIDGRAMSSGNQQMLEQVIAQLAGVEVGRIQGFILDRVPAKRGMSCRGFDGKAQESLLSLMGTDPMFGPGRTIREKPYAEPVLIGGCQALRFRGKGTTAQGAGKNLDVFAVSDGKVLYLFKLLNVDEHYSHNVELFERIVSTVTLAGLPRSDR